MVDPSVGVNPSPEESVGVDDGVFSSVGVTPSPTVSVKFGLATAMVSVICPSPKFCASTVEVISIEKIMNKPNKANVLIFFLLLAR